MLSEDRKREIKKQAKRDELILWTKILSPVIVIGLVWGVYKLAYDTIWDPAKVKGYCTHQYVEPRHGDYVKMHVSYTYEYNGKSYVGSEVNILSGLIRKGDTLLIEISKSDPNFHKVLGRINKRPENFFWSAD